MKRFTPSLMTVILTDGVFKNNYGVMDNLRNEHVENLIKASYDLAQQAADTMNDRYEQAMERQRKQIFNDSYSVRR